MPGVCKCGICGDAIGRRNSIQCDVCESWIHQTCGNVSDADYALFSNNVMMKFICANCGKNPNRNQPTDEFRSLHKKLDDILRKGQEDINSLKDSLNSAVDDIKSEMGSYMKEIKDDIVACNNRISNVEASTCSKISHLEEENHVLYKRLNRADIVIRGLPEGLEDLVPVVVALGAFFNIPVAGHDISHACYINFKKLVLVKFNNVFLRDNIMKEYFKSRTLRRCNIIGDDVVSENSDLNVSAINGAAGNVAAAINGATVAAKITDRVFLNDHYSPAATRLNAACRKLLYDKAIKKYKIFNNDKLKAKITLLNGRELEVHGAAEVDDMRSGGML